MTLIQPNKKQTPFHTAFLLLAFIPIIAGTVWFILLYNKTVDLTHRMGNARDEVQRVESETALLKDSMFSLLSRTNLETVARAQGLVTDNHPHYLTLHQWEFASHF